MQCKKTMYTQQKLILIVSTFEATALTHGFIAKIFNG